LRSASARDSGVCVAVLVRGAFAEASQKIAKHGASASAKAALAPSENSQKHGSNSAAPPSPPIRASLRCNGNAEPMPSIELTDEEHAALAAALRRLIDEDRFPTSGASTPAPRPC
jgi:hypothetical protein